METGQDIQQSRLAAARGADHANKLIFHDIQVDAVKCDGCSMLAFILFDYIFNVEFYSSRLSCHDVSLLSIMSTNRFNRSPMMPMIMM